jgi:hypothetical protein
LSFLEIELLYTSGICILGTPPEIEMQFALFEVADIGVIQTLPEGRNVITTPTMVLPMPPSSSHKVLLVGAPVKIREMPDPAESDAFIP